MGIGAVLVALCCAGLWIRQRVWRAMTAVTLTRRRLGPDGIVIGGEGFELPRRSAPAVLLLHGAGDTPQTLRYLGAELHERGFHVEAPLLPGHGRTLREFARTAPDELLRTARESYDRLLAAHEWVGIIGLSMGGALAVQLAANLEHLPALGLVAPYLAMPRRVEWLARLSWLWGLLVPAMPSSEGISILDPVERSRNLAYGVFTASALRALHRIVRRSAAALPRVAAPTLMIQSREDNRISVSAAERAFERLGSHDKTLIWVTGAAHVITVDIGREEVIARLATFMDAHCPARSRPTTAPPLE